MPASLGNGSDKGFGGGWDPGIQLSSSETGPLGGGSVLGVEGALVPRPA